MNALHRIAVLASAAMACSSVPLLASPPMSARQVDGFTEPYRTINVAALESGVITRLDAHEGEVVCKGQVLATLDSDLLEARATSPKPARTPWGDYAARRPRCD